MDGYIGEIKLFGGNFAPRNWAFCHGQLLPIQQNTALFSIVGTIYGGDGRTTFGLPDLRGRAPIGAGTGPGLTPRSLGGAGGQEQVALTAAEMPSHRHGVRGTSAPADDPDPADNYLARAEGDAYNQGGAAANLAADALDPAGGGQAHDNMPPFRGMNYIICLFGVFPSRS